MYDIPNVAVFGISRRNRQDSQTILSPDSEE